ncbi:serine hydrolase [Bacillus sp. AFS015802]|uniref:serine hydrolase n=1 Tax=Bacillus sp. AFS015802 TaxID=2033486 RepID=UPI0015CF2A18|nr:serine hydrolase [Bacillus sp. AFS015802]
MDTMLEHSIQEIAERCDGMVSVAVDLPSQAIHINGDRPCSAASLIKIPILLEGFRQSEKGMISLSEKVYVPKDERVGGAGVLTSLSENVSLTIEDLLTLMIIVSDNTASNLLIDRLGSKPIQDLCHSLNLKQTKLMRKLMDFKAMEQGLNNFTSAHDIITCLKVMDNGEQFSQTSREKMLNILQQQQFDNKLPSRMDREKVFVANKTGELPGVEHDCAILKFKNKTAYIAVLIDELDENEYGKDTIARIGKLIFNSLINEEK